MTSLGRPLKFLLPAFPCSHTVTAANSDWTISNKVSFNWPAAGRFKIGGGGKSAIFRQTKDDVAERELQYYKSMLKSYFVLKTFFLNLVGTGGSGGGSTSASSWW